MSKRQGRGCGWWTERTRLPSKESFSRLLSLRRTSQLSCVSFTLPNYQHARSGQQTSRSQFMHAPSVREFENLDVQEGGCVARSQ